MSNIQLRWLTVETHVTGEEVRKYANENQLALMHAKDLLRNRVGPILQYHSDGVWHDIPHVREYRNKDD